MQIISVLWHKLCWERSDVVCYDKNIINATLERFVSAAGLLK